MYVIVPGQLSVAVGDNAWAAVKPDASEQSSVLFKEPVAVVHVGGALSTFLVIVCAHVAVLPHASVALYVLTVVSVQLSVLTTSPTNVIAGVPVQLSVAVTDVISAAGTVALHAKFKVAGQLIVGGVTSTIQVTVREVVDVLLQASVAVKVLVCDLPQPEVVTAPSAEVTVGVPHPSVAVALPRAASI